MTTKHNKTLARAAGAAVALALVAAPALADVFTKEELIKSNKEAAGGGKGTLVGEYAFTRDKALKDHAIKEISWLTLQPGDSIGFHKHTTNEDTYSWNSVMGGSVQPKRCGTMATPAMRTSSWAMSAGTMDTARSLAATSSPMTLDDRLST